VAFGKLPQAWGARLSPDGSKISFLHMVEADIPMLFVAGPDEKPRPVLASKPGDFDIRWCRWVSNDRLLCGFYGITRDRGFQYGVTRLVAVNSDGAEQKVLLQEKLKDQRTQFQDDVIDWLPDDPDHVLIAMPDDSGTGVNRLNVHTGRTSVHHRVREGVFEWKSDGRGVVRLRCHVTIDKSKWSYRLADDEEWQVLHEHDMTDVDDDYYPLGFGEDRNALLVFKPHQGRMALWAEDLNKRIDDRLIYSHPDVDVGGPLRLGKFDRLVAVSYSTDRPHYHFFDGEIERIVERIHKIYPDRLVGVLDESWDKRIYLIHISSDEDPGHYYCLDTQLNTMRELWSRHPHLQNRQLGKMKPIRYSARDGVQIPGYLTLPPDKSERALPAVILPHGGPEARDQWGFDWLPQFMAARGYAVLQSSFRGSGGYGADWSGEGGFRAWRRTIGDITDGTKWLIQEGIADSERICIVGWSYGGYAALMSAIEEPELYKCTVSIAGVTDPWMLIEDYRHFRSKLAVSEFIGRGEKVLKNGSPLERAEEIQSPVLLFHGDDDLRVKVRHGKKMHKALKKAKASTELVTYKDIGHSIWRDNYRVDMLDKIGRFLDDHIGGTPTPAQTAVGD
jgi:dipeptidyl aminopeptidase/acylaminoacyl peptidase